MFVHTVYFYVKPATPPAAIDDLVAGCRDVLAKIPTVRKLYAGRPAPDPDPRPVVDTTYAVGLTVLFDDAAGHDVYQEHPLHLQFIERNSAHWARVQVYDYIA